MPVKNGLILIAPTSVVKTGTGSTATINTNGSVTFSSCESLSLNGVFSADYDNYMVVMRFTTATGVGTRMRMRASGTNDSTSYVNQTFIANGGSFNAARYTTIDGGILPPSYGVQRAGSITHIYGPNLSQPTAVRSVGAADQSGAMLYDTVWTHGLSTSYDGATIYLTSSNMTGLVAVYGLRK